MPRIDAAELAQWFDACAAGLVLYARQWVRSPLAEDVVQEAFVRLAGLRERPEHVRAWLATTVRNGAMDALRRHRRSAARERRAGEARLLIAREQGEETALEAGEVQAALEKLPLEQREVITLRIWNGATFEEIATVTGMPLSTVYHRYKSGLEELKARWEVPCPKS